MNGEFSVPRESTSEIRQNAPTFGSPGKIVIDFSAVDDDVKSSSYCHEGPEEEHDENGDV